MDVETQAVLFEAVPLLTVAALSLVVGASSVLLLRRERGRAGSSSPAPAAHGRGGSTIGLSQQLLDASEPSDVARVLLDELAEAFELDLANMALIEDGGQAAVIVAAREGRKDHLGLVGKRIALDREPSGINAAISEGRAFTVYDAEHSAVVNQRLNAIAKAKSCVYVPVRAAEEVIGVVFGAVRRPRVFDEPELVRMQALVSEGGLALERSRATIALADALERERLISHVSLELRSRRDVDEVLPAVLAEIGVVLDAARCFVRLGEPADARGVAAEWAADGVPPLGDASRLPVVNLCVRLRRTVAVADVLATPALDDGSLGDVRGLSAHGVHAVLATPILAQDRLLGVLAVHRSIVGDWSPGEIALAEAVAREAAVALDTSRLLREGERRLAEQEALLKAGQALTSDLRFDVVIERLVSELRALVNADAADCWTLLPGGTELVCRAVLGLPAEVVGGTTPVAGAIGEAITAGKPVLRTEAEPVQPGAAGNGAAFAEAMNAPISSFGEIRGALGVYSREAGRFEESDLRLLEAFASLASIALRNAEAYEESTRRAQVERGFYRIAAVLSEPLSEQETLDAVAQAAADALGGDSAAVFRGAGSAIELAGGYELADGLAAHLRESASSLATCARGGKVLASRRLRDDDRFGEGLGAAAAAAGRDSLLAVPLQQPGGQGAGLVLVFFHGERAFDDEQLELAAQVAAAARGALERSALYERERRSRHLAQRLAQSGRELAGELDPDNVLDASVRLAVLLLGADGASVRMLEGDEVVVRSAAGPGGADALDTRAPSTGWLVGDIVQTRGTRAIADIAADPRVGEADAMLAAGYGGYLGVPMIGPEESASGILAVYSLRAREWREEEAEALLALAATAAAARANAELYQGVSHEQQRGEAILANVADGIVAVDRDGKVVLWNPAAERVTGVSQAEALGKTPTEALGRPLDAAGGAAPGGSGLLPIRRGSEEVWLSLSEAVMTDPAGAVAGRIYAFRDISAERSVEQMKSDFVSTVSHELRTPLTSIYGFAETLLRQDVLFGDEERATFLRYIASESERLTAIVDRLLSVAQLDTGAMAVQLAETDVGAVVSEAVRSAEGADGQNGHRFVVDIADEPLSAEADREKLGQVLAHLLDNAVRYSPAGGTVTVAARRSEDAVEVSVEDEGVGIPHAEQERIFRKFYRGDAAAAGAVGAGAAGLGLFLAEGLVTAMGGRIRVDSGEGKGSTFVLELRPAESET